MFIEYMVLDFDRNDFNVKLVGVVGVVVLILIKIILDLKVLVLLKFFLINM